MHAAADLQAGRTHLERQHHLMDQLPRVRPDDLRPEQPAGFGLRHQGDEALGRSHGQGPAHLGKRMSTDDHPVPLPPGRFLCQTDGGDLRVGKDRVGYLASSGRDILAREDPPVQQVRIVAGAVGEHRSPDHVTNRPDALPAGLESVIDDDEPLGVPVHPHRIQIELIRVRGAAHRYQHGRSLHRPSVSVHARGEADSVTGLFGPRHPGIEQHVDPLAP